MTFSKVALNCSKSSSNARDFASDALLYISKFSVSALIQVSLPPANVTSSAQDNSQLKPMEILRVINDPKSMKG